MLRRDNNKQRETYKDILQINFEDQAVLFAAGHDKTLGTAPGNIYAEELDQLENLDEFVKHVDSFIPLGFVPTWFSREKIIES